MAKGIFNLNTFIIRIVVTERKKPEICFRAIELTEQHRRLSICARA